jgi:hypothetical protein
MTQGEFIVVCVMTKEIGVVSLEKGCLIRIDIIFCCCPESPPFARGITRLALCNETYLPRLKNR